MTAGLGCAVLAILMVVVIPAAYLLPRASELREAGGAGSELQVSGSTDFELTPVYQLEGLLPQTSGASSQGSQGPAQGSLEELYERLSPGIVSVQAYEQNSSLLTGRLGSGFLFDDEGHILTNYHLVDGAAQVGVVFYDGFEAQAEIVGTDRDSNLAVIKIEDTPKSVSPLPLGEPDPVRVGEWVVAIGSPSGTGTSLTTGVVSAIDGSVSFEKAPFTIPLVIQIDRAFPVGSSGGPLFDLQGELVGVAVQTEMQPDEGLGFVIPAEVIWRVAPALVREGRFDWPWLGLEGISVNLPIMEANELEAPQGVYVNAIIPDGPADQAGLQGPTRTKTLNGLAIPVAGDVILEIDGKPVNDLQVMQTMVMRKTPGEIIQLTILRDGQRNEVSLTLAPRPKD
jgi:2-alkenal reductase